MLHLTGRLRRITPAATPSSCKLGWLLRETLSRRSLGEPAPAGGSTARPPGSYCSPRRTAQSGHGEPAPPPPPAPPRPKAGGTGRRGASNRGAQAAAPP